MRGAAFLGLMGILLAAGALDSSAPAAPAQPASFASAQAAPVALARSTRPAPADTMHRRVTAGEPLIVTLPDALSDRAVTAYRLLHAPALSWLVGRSLLWRTRMKDIGAHALLIHAAFAETPSDTLTVLVDVTE